MYKREKCVGHMLKTLGGCFQCLAEIVFFFLILLLEGNCSLGLRIFYFPFLIKKKKTILILPFDLRVFGIFSLEVIS